MTTRTEFQAELADLIRGLQPTIGDDYRAYDDSDSDEPSMLLIIGVDAKGWGWQTGDNSYTGGAYSYANRGFVALTRDADAETLAAELLSDLESWAYDEAVFFYDTGESQS